MNHSPVDPNLNTDIGMWQGSARSSNVVGFPCALRFPPPHLTKTRTPTTFVSYMSSRFLSNWSNLLEAILWVIKPTLYFLDIVMHSLRLATINYNASFVYCREFAPGTISLTGDLSMSTTVNKTRIMRFKFHQHEIT